MVPVHITPNWMTDMKRHEPCAHLRPDYDRLEKAHYIIRDPETDEILWEPTGLEVELARLGLIQREEYECSQS